MTDMASLYRQAEVLEYAKLSPKEQKWLKEDIAKGDGTVLNRFTKAVIKTAEDMAASDTQVKETVKKMCKQAVEERPAYFND